MWADDLAKEKCAKLDPSASLETRARNKGLHIVIAACSALTKCAFTYFKPIHLTHTHTHTYTGLHPSTLLCLLLIQCLQVCVGGQACSTCMLTCLVHAAAVCTCMCVCLCVFAWVLYWWYICIVVFEINNTSGSNIFLWDQVGIWFQQKRHHKTRLTKFGWCLKDQQPDHLQRMDQCVLMSPSNL